MVSVVFNSSGFFHVIELGPKEKINSEWYCNKCLTQVFEQYVVGREKTGLRKMLFHHDNAPSHTSLKTTEFLEEKSVRVLPHPPYSPDLAPADFFLFPKAKDLMRGKSFDTLSDVTSYFSDQLKSFEKSDWKMCFQLWFERMNKCIEHDGEYFEKQ